AAAAAGVHGPPGGVRPPVPGGGPGVIGAALLHGAGRPAAGAAARPGLLPAAAAARAGDVAEPRAPLRRVGPALGAGGERPVGSVADAVGGVVLGGTAAVGDDARGAAGGRARPGAGRRAVPGPPDTGPVDGARSVVAGPGAGCRRGLAPA